MAHTRDLEMLERGAYRRSYSDGIIDTFLGISMAWMGVAWVWLPDLAGVAGIFPAVLATPILELRKRVVEPRGGYVRWGEPRRRAERRNLMVALAGGLALLSLGVAALFVAGGSSPLADVLDAAAPGLLAWLLALMSIGIGIIMGAWRMLGYAGVLVIGGILTAWTDGNPGWPLLGAGLIITIAGLILVVRFIRANRVIETR